MLKYGHLFNVDIKILIFKAWWYESKTVFRVKPKSTLFQRWILSINQRWQIDVELTWISRWPTSQRWINVECLLGIERRYIFWVKWDYQVLWAFLSAFKFVLQNMLIFFFIIISQRGSEVPNATFQASVYVTIDTAIVYYDMYHS